MLSHFLEELKPNSLGAADHLLVVWSLEWSHSLWASENRGQHHHSLLLLLPWTPLRKGMRNSTPTYSLDAQILVDWGYSFSPEKTLWEEGK